MDNLRLLENKPVSKKNISILPIPLDIGSENTGMDEASSHLFKSGLTKALSQAGLKPIKLKPVSVRKTKNRLFDISKVAEQTNVIVKNELAAENKILCLGGDHAISIGSISGAAEAFKGSLGVIWIDAHPDLHTHQTSISGFVHGMVSMALMGFGHKNLTGFMKHKIKPQNFIYIGLKDLDQAEIDFIRQHNLKVFTMFDIVEKGFIDIATSIANLQKRVSNIWISFDVDSVDKLYAPASAMATSGGLTYREAINLVTYIGKTCNVAGLDIVEFTPKKDRKQQTTELCFEIAAAAFGSKYDWYTRYMNDHSG